MKTKDISMQQSVLRILVGTAALLLIPLIGQWPWSFSDFVVTAVLIFIAGLGLDLFLRNKSSQKQKALVGLAILIGILWLYVELAVGLFTNWGS